MEGDQFLQDILEQSSNEIQSLQEKNQKSNEEIQRLREKNQKSNEEIQRSQEEIQKLNEVIQRLQEENQRLVELLLSQTKVDSGVDGGCEESKVDEDECKEYHCDDLLVFHQEESDHQDAKRLQEEEVSRFSQSLSRS